MQSLGNEFADHSQLHETIKPPFPIRTCITICKTWNSPGVQWLRLRPPNLWGLRSSPSRGTRSHMTQPKIYRLQQKLKILQAMTKTLHSPKKKKKKQIHYQALYKKMFAHVHSITIDCLKIRLTFGGKKKKL